ncbi:hypothetical protein B0H34DRAFT_447521 [Crassisporium funariophilum]|nr:hypothetical protein B0H34DRAFT_447521 [Crassisporium funariophilum]
MSVPQSHDAQLGEQHLEEQDDKIHQEEASEMDRMNTGGEVPEILKPKKKRERKEPVTLERELGKSLFPISRVQKIIRADKEIPVMAKDATFLISLATEEFIKRLTEAGQQIAHREKRATVQHKDIATVVRKADEFLFLEGVSLIIDAWTPHARVPFHQKLCRGLHLILQQSEQNRREQAFRPVVQHCWTNSWSIRRHGKRSLGEKML